MSSVIYKKHGARFGIFLRFASTAAILNVGKSSGLEKILKLTLNHISN